MAKIRALYAIMDTFLVGIWGLTIIDLMAIANIGEYDATAIDDGIKTILAVAGLFYLLVVKIPNEIAMNKLRRREKKLDNEAKRMANKEFKDTHDG